MPVVAFVEADFRARYPQFTAEKAPGAWLEALFGEACLLLDNTEGSPVPYDPGRGQMARKILLQQLVCHLATLELAAREGQPGPVASATEGSVSVSYAVPQMTSAAGDWFQRTPCGAAFWRAMQGYILGGRYFPGRKAHPWG